MEKVKVSKDGSSIDFVQSEKLPVSPKKFRNGPELEGFYRFIFDNDLRKEALAIIDKVLLSRKAKKIKSPLEALMAKPATKVAAPKAEAKKEVKIEAKKVETKKEAKVKVQATKAAKAAKPKATAKSKTAKKVVAKKPAKAKSKK